MEYKNIKKYQNIWVATDKIHFGLSMFIKSWQSMISHDKPVWISHLSSWNIGVFVFSEMLRTRWLRTSSTNGLKTGLAPTSPIVLLTSSFWRSWRHSKLNCQTKGNLALSLFWMLSNDRTNQCGWRSVSKSSLRYKVGILMEDCAWGF